MTLSNVERQRQYRERRAAGEPVRDARGPQGPTAAAKAWATAVDELRTLHADQAEYEAWRDQLPRVPWPALRTVELPRASATVNLDALDVQQLPRGFGHD